MDILQTGKFGVLTQQKLIGTTSNNISNVNTTGYTRQSTTVYTSAQEWGIGETVTRRLYDKYVQREMFRDQGNVGFYDAYGTGLGTVDNLLSKSDTSIATQLDSVFSSMESAVQNTSSLANRRELLTQLNNLVDRYHTLNYNIKNEINDINNKINDSAASINDLVKGFYEVNHQVNNLSKKEQQSEIGLQLMDKRDELVNQLSSLVDVNLVQESTGSYSLYLGNGQLLANNDTYGQVKVMQDEADNTKRSLNLTFEIPNHTELTLGDENWGGQIGGYLAAAGDMRQAMRDLGQNALAFADAMNQQNKGGLTLEGKAGQDLITLPKVDAVALNGTTGSMSVSFNIGEGSDIHSNDYEVSWDQNGDRHVYMLDGAGNKEELDPANIQEGTDANGNLTLNLVGHGITMNFNQTEQAMQQSQSAFKVQPTLNSGYNIKTNIAKPEDFAFASAIRANTTSQNAGNATVSLVGVYGSGPQNNYAIEMNGNNEAVFKTDAPTFVRYEEDFDGQGTNGYVIYTGDPNGNPAGTKLGYTPAETNGKNIFANAIWDDPNLNTDPDGTGADPSVGGYPGYDVSFEGTVKNQDSFSIEINNNAVNDNSNGNLLANLKHGDLVYATDSIKNTFTADYADLTSAVGSAVMSATTDLTAASAKLEQSQNLFSSNAGVNLDEEATNLIRYQQSYSACARIISASQTIFESLLSAI